MKGMSEREYAAHAGLSRGAVQKAKQSKRLVLYPDGSINVVASDDRYRGMTQPAKARADPGGAPITGSVDPAAFLKARTANEIIKARRGEMLLARDRGELVDRARAEQLVFQLARQERDAWVTWPSRVAAVMAAEIAAEVENASGHKVVIDPGITQRILEHHVRIQLEGLSNPGISIK